MKKRIMHEFQNLQKKSCSKIYRVGHKNTSNSTYVFCLSIQTTAILGVSKTHNHTLNDI